MSRIDGRTPEQLRPVTIERGWSKHAEGSVLISFGDTKVFCTASVTEGVPRWRKGSGEGWVTGEYSMLPRATNTRGDRESVRGKIGGRTHEIDLREQRQLVVGERDESAVDGGDDGRALARTDGHRARLQHTEQRLVAGHDADVAGGGTRDDQGGLAGPDTPVRGDQLDVQLSSQGWLLGSPPGGRAGCWGQF